MEVRVLGSVEIVGDAGEFDLPGRKRWRLLTALLVDAGNTLPVGVLIDAVWQGTPPASAHKLVQVYISQLRKALPDGVQVETRRSGYALVLDASRLDAARFERLLSDGSAALREGNPELALSLLDRGLALWRGAAYGELAFEDFVRTEAERLDELRLVAAEERFDAALALGRHAELSVDIQKAAAEQPWRERPHAQAMLALYRCGQQTEALELYARLRERLHDDLGLEPSRDLRDLQQGILRHDPSLDAPRADAAPLIDMPVPPNPLLGRERELDELRELLVRDDVRLLVLTGAGGAGKTRLALEAAHAAATSFANGVVFAELAPLRDPALILGVIADTLGIELTRREEPMTALAAYLHRRQLLLVIDNAEHLHDAATVLSRLLTSAARLTLLVTSRSALRLSGEHVYPVQPLAEEPAIALFHARARQADAHYAPSEQDDRVIRDICTRLDGLPLAIELAAARTATLAPGDLLERLDPRLPLLVGGPRDVPARQQTLRATLAWSFDLLSPAERTLADRIAVFVGRFDLESAVSVCDADLPRLTSLVEQSLLQRAADDRFLYLETIREYALDRLLRAPDTDEIRRRHFGHFLRLAESADLSAVRRRSGERLDLAVAALDNLRAALAWSIETGAVALGLELASAMERFWVTHDPREGMRWFRALLAHPEADRLAPALLAPALRAYGSATDIAGDGDAARSLYEQSLAVFERLGDERGRAVLLLRLGMSALRRGDLSLARELVEASHAIHERIEDGWGQAQTTGALGAIARDAGDGSGARELIETSLAMAREAGVRWWESGMLAELAVLCLNAGRTDEAETRAREALSLATQIGDRAGCVFGVGIFAGIAAARGQRERAEQLWATVAREDAVAPLGGWRHHRTSVEAIVRQHFDSALHCSDESSELKLDAAITLAVGSPNDDRRPPTRP